MLSNQLEWSYLDLVTRMQFLPVSVSSTKSEYKVTCIHQHNNRILSIPWPRYNSCHVHHVSDVTSRRDLGRIDSNLIWLDTEKKYNKQRCGLWIYYWPLLRKATQSGNQLENEIIILSWLTLKAQDRIQHEFASQMLTNDSLGAKGAIFFKSWFGYLCGVVPYLKWLGISESSSYWNEHKKMEFLERNVAPHVLFSTHRPSCKGDIGMRSFFHRTKLVLQFTLWRQWRTALKRHRGIAVLIPLTQSIDLNANLMCKRNLML